MSLPSPVDEYKETLTTEPLSAATGAGVAKKSTVGFWASPGEEAIALPAELSVRRIGLRLWVCHRLVIALV